MSDIWENNPQDLSGEPVEPQAPETPVVPETPVAPDQPVASEQPVHPPFDGFAPDGSYRYVPPREPGYPPPVQPTYYAPAPQQPVQPTPPPKRKDRGWIAAVAILAALAVLISGMSFAFWWIDRETNIADKEDEKTSQSDNQSENNKKPSKNDKEDEPNEDAPSVEQKPSVKPDDVDPEQDYYYGDGGLSTETIVNMNYHSTVVLTMYMKSNSYYFGEGSLQEVGAASGIVWTADGYIITNCHCVKDESSGDLFDRIDVTMYDGTVYEDAEVIGADESTDLAVIKVDATDLVPAEFGDSDELAVGARVVALGNAAGLSWTATQGIVSAKARDVYDDTGYAIQCLQVDVAINSGNSGGPLLNKYGQVIAINSAKIAASGYEGLGFSIPINEAKVVLESLAKYGYVKGRVSLGITGATYDDGIYQGFAISKVTDPTGWLDTETDKWQYMQDGWGRVQRMTLILAVDDVNVVDYGSLRAELAKHEVGDTVTLTLLHYDRNAYEVTTHYVDVVLQEQTAN